jgi:hypothetical protein
MDDASCRFIALRVTDFLSVSLSNVLLIAVSGTTRWVTSRHSAQLGVVEILFG